MSASLVGSEMCIRDRERVLAAGEGGDLGGQVGEGRPGEGGGPGAGLVLGPPVEAAGGPGEGQRD
eukprot:8945279-Alexandrium_andersonii.AAC.1